MQFEHYLHKCYWITINKWMVNYNIIILPNYVFHVEPYIYTVLCPMRLYSLPPARWSRYLCCTWLYLIIKEKLALSFSHELTKLSHQSPRTFLWIYCYFGYLLCIIITCVRSSMLIKYPFHSDLSSQLSALEFSLWQIRKNDL